MPQSSSVCFLRIPMAHSLASSIMSSTKFNNSGFGSSVRWFSYLSNMLDISFRSASTAGRTFLWTPCTTTLVKLLFTGGDNIILRATAALFSLFPSLDKFEVLVKDPSDPTSDDLSVELRTSRLSITLIISWYSVLVVREILFSSSTFCIGSTPVDCRTFIPLIWLRSG